MKVLLTDIWIPSDRHRRTIDESRIDSLALSMQSPVGLINPIVIIREPDENGHNFRLVAGERRVRAARKLNWLEIEATDRENLTPLQREEIELDENLQREDLAWKEECDAKARIWAVRAELYGETVDQVADHLNVGRGSLWEDARLAKSMEEHPELATAKNKTQAQSRLRLIKRREGLEELAKRRVILPSKDGDYSDRVYLGNCINIMKEFESGSKHLVLTDPPYGIDLGEGETKKSNPHPTIYDDAHYDIMDLVDLSAREAFRLLVSDAHAYFWFDIKAYAKVFSILTNAGFAVEPIPLVWAKNISGQVNHPGSRWGSSYEVCFFCRKGDRALLKQGGSNVLKYDVVPSGKKIHPTEKPVALLRQLIEASTVVGESVLDMFGGSGSTAEAAIQTGRNFIIIEKDPAYREGILERLSKVSVRNDCLHVFDKDVCINCGKKKYDKSLVRPDGEPDETPDSLMDEDEERDWEEALNKGGSD